MKIFRSNSADVFALLISVVSVVSATTCDKCNFDGLEDFTACKDYGLIDNEVLIGWHIASDQCLDEFSLKITSSDPTLICSSTNSFVNELKFGSSLNTAKPGLGVGSNDDGQPFFTDDGNLQDTIIVDDITYDCEASESDCYNAMKPYFETNPNGMKEMDDVCSQLQNKVINDRQLEQSTVRNRLCLEYNDGTTIPVVCEPLWSQLLEQMNQYPNKGCQGYAFGTQNKPIPGCETENNNNVQSTNDTSQARHPTPTPSLLFSAIAIVVLSLL